MCVGIIHRIDRQTSGVLVIGKTAFAMNELMNQWKQHSTVKRKYTALVHGAFQPQTMIDNVGTHTHACAIIHLFNIRRFVMYIDS